MIAATSSLESPRSTVALPAATVADDAALLGPWTRAFEAVCGAPVMRIVLDPSGQGEQLAFPPVFRPVELIGGTGHFRQHPAMAEQVRRMGFDWTGDGRVMTVPAPGAFNARLASAGLPEAGFSLCCANAVAPSMPLGPWLLRYMQGTMTVLVNAPSYYASLLRPDQPPWVREDARWGLWSVAHDLSVHALNYHLVPHAAIADLSQRIERAVPDRHASWSDTGAIAPLTLTYFYDNDFNRYTYAVWCRCERPQDFGALFTARHNYDQLLAALDVRLDETRAGCGDVASGNFDDMGPLAETQFDVR